MTEISNSAKSGQAMLMVPVVVHNGIAYVSGQLPRQDGVLKYTGKLGAEVSIEDGQRAARLCAERALEALVAQIGGTDKIVRVLKVLGFVASAEGFSGQGAVINGASEFLIETLGEKGRHARSSIGVAELPRNGTVEVEMVVAVSE